MTSCCNTTNIAKEKIQVNEVTIEQKTNFSKENMVLIEGGEFFIGTNGDEGFPADGEGPARKITIDSYYIDQYTVTNADFEKFVRDTNYVTEAEQFGWSFVFHLFVPDKILKTNPGRPPNTPWWIAVDGAYWRKPEGPGSSIKKRKNHPVIHISWNDALAYAKWCGKRLPTEAEWEVAARGGLEQKVFPWGDELVVDGKYQCNTWQGKFPTTNTKGDGYIGTAPVNSYAPNGYGLYNIVGNVWEWCEDWFTPTYHQSTSSINPVGSNPGTNKSLRGGSYLCHKSYCNRYRVAARSSNTPDSSTGNIGFRCVADA